MLFEFSILSSGSSGNSTYIGTKNTKILIDAGLSGKKIEQALLHINLLPSELDAIFVTHEHSDHIDGVGVLSRRFNIPIFATNGTWDAMKNKIGNISYENKKIIYPEEYCYVNDIVIKPFSVSHDANEPVCFAIKNNFKKIVIATDIGYVSKSLIENLRHCDVLLLESNYDIDMLKKSNYNYVLKKRILGKFGHLSNCTSAKLLACVMNDRLKNVVLCHLSDENNNPTLAYDTFCKILDEFAIKPGVHFNLNIATPDYYKKVVSI